MDREALREIERRFAAEAEAADVLGERYRYGDVELHAQYATEARTWRQAQRMLARALLAESQETEE